MRKEGLLKCFNINKDVQIIKWTYKEQFQNIFLADIEIEKRTLYGDKFRARELDKINLMWLNLKM